MAEFEAELLENILVKARDRESGLSIKDRRWMLKNFKKCFVGSEFVDWLIKIGEISSRSEGEALGQRMMANGLLLHVTMAHSFKDDHLFYRFVVRAPSCFGIFFFFILRCI